MKRIGRHATPLEEREYSSSDYVHCRRTILEVKNEQNDRITGEFLCEYGITREWLCFYDSAGYEWESCRYSFPKEWSIVNLSLGRSYGASVSCGYESHSSSQRDFMVDFFENSRHLFTWEPREAGLHDLGGVELNNADVASYPGWALLEWDEDDLFDCESRNDDFVFRTEKEGREQHLPRLLPLGRMAGELNTSGLLEMIRKSAEPGVRLAGVILLSDPEALRSLCSEAEDPAVREKAAKRLALYETLGYFPPDACEMSQLSEEEEYGGYGYMYGGDDFSTTQAAIHALTHPSYMNRADWLMEVNDFELAAYISRHDKEEWTRISAAKLMARLNG